MIMVKKNTGERRTAEQLVGEIEELQRQLNALLSSQKKQLETETDLKYSIEGFSAILDSLDSIVYVSDMNTYELLFINKYGRDLLGNITGKICWQALQSKKDGPCEFCTNNKLLDAEGKPTGVYIWEFQNTVNNRWYECRDQAIRWIDGRLVRLEIATDITQRREANGKLVFEISQRKQVENQLKVLVEEVERGNKELQEFAYVVSHDLKAPLRGITSLAGWLAEDYGEVLDQEGKEMLDRLVGRTLRMNHLIDGILQYSRVGRTKAEPQQLDVKAIVEDLIDELAISDKIKILIPHPLPPVVFDKILLHQILQNLLGNAVKHMGKPQGQITVTCRKRKKEKLWEFCVKDTGTGIEERYHQRIFQIFQTLTAANQEGSTGIGLSLVKKIVERNGGTVWLESQPGAGSKFYFTIPQHPPPNGLKPQSTVLIVDDNVEFVDVAATMLEREGHKVLCSASGDEAYNLLKDYEGTIDIALIDVYIPDEDPFDRFDRIKALRPKMKTIVCTGSGLTDIIEKLEKKGVDGVLNKPFSIEQLNAIIKSKLLPPQKSSDGKYPQKKAKNVPQIQ